MVSRSLPSALVVEIPEAEPAVGQLRDRLDANARLGVPAHVTVVYPFAPAGAIDPAVRQQLADLFGSVPSFGFRLDHVGWFGEVVVHLTVGHDCPVAELRAAEEEIRPQLPIEGTVETVSLLTRGPDGRWRRSAKFSLGR